MDPTRGRILRLAVAARRTRLEGDAARAVKELVAYTPGTAFYADGGGRQNIRLSFCYPTSEMIKVGIARLATVINGELDLLNTFSSARLGKPVTQREGVTMPPPNMS
jgi:hypothetical protein